MTKEEALQKLLGNLGAQEREQEAKAEDAKAHRDALKELKAEESELRTFLEKIGPLENLR
jgi:hypothetical protein